MLEVARARAHELGIENVEFKRLELEWIDMPTASVDAVLCKWGVMFAVDPPAAVREIRRVLRPGGRVALAVWDVPPVQPVGDDPDARARRARPRPPPDPDAPGCSRWRHPGGCRSCSRTAGFLDVVVAVARDAARARMTASRSTSPRRLDLSSSVRAMCSIRSPDEQRAEVVTDRVAELARPYVGEPTGCCAARPGASGRGRRVTRSGRA